MKMRHSFLIVRLLAAMLLIVAWCGAQAQGWPGSYGGVMLQGFYWDSYSDSNWANLESQADDMAGAIDLIWIPNAANCGYGTQMGYAPLYWFNNYESSFGTEAQLRSMVTTFKNKGIGVLGDVVINHRGNVSTWTDFPAEVYNGTTYQLYSTDICADDDGGDTYYWGQAQSPVVSLSSNWDTGDDWSGMRDLDHKSSNVQRCVKAFLNMLLNDLGYTGFRYDMVVGFAPRYIREYNNATAPAFSVGECWKSSEEIRSWIEGTKSGDWPTSAAFDFQFRYTVKNAANNSYWSNLDNPNDGYPLVSNNFYSGGYRQWAVTFIENHDTQYRNAYEQLDPIRKDTLACNAYMLAMPGTPCVFLPHWQEYMVEIKNMIAARKAAGITNTSDYAVRSSGASRHLSTTYGSRTNLICAVGTGVGASSSTPSNTVEILSGYHYKYYMPASANLAWADVPSGRYSDEFDVTLTAVSSSYTTVVYTTDGTEPTASNGTQVASGTRVHVGASMTLKAALLNGNTVVSGSAVERNYNVVVTNKITVYFKAPTGTWDNVYFYSWDGNGAYPTGGWPGKHITKTKLINGSTFYYHTFESTADNYSFYLIIGNGGGGSYNQTIDVGPISADAFYELNGVDSNQDNKYKVTDVTADYGSALKATVYFQDPGWETVKYYAWDNSGNQLLGAWSGTAITTTTVIEGETYYYHTFTKQNDGDSFNVLFNDGNGTQTVDLTGITGDVYYKLGQKKGGKYELVAPYEEVPEFEPYVVTVYFKNPGWDNTMNCHAWASDGTIKNGDGTDKTDSWPGLAMSTTTIGGETWYYRSFLMMDENVKLNVIFTNKNSGSNQTVDITGITEDKYYELTGEKEGDNYKVQEAFFPYQVTVYFKQPESGWDDIAFYAWESDGTVKNGDGTTMYDEWPGQVSNSIKYIDGEPWYYRTFLIATDGAKVNMVINNNGQGSQTVDLTGITTDKYYSLDELNGSKYDCNEADEMTEVINSIAINRPVFTLGFHANYTLYATVTGTNVSSPVVWTSSDESVVKVSSGSIQPLSARANGPRRSAAVGGNIYGVDGGTATITATVGGVSATSIVTVDPTTGVVEVVSDKPIVTARDGKVVIDSPVKTVAHLVAPDGRSRTVTVNPGVNTYDFHAPIVIVSIGSHAVKLRL